MERWAKMELIFLFSTLNQFKMLHGKFIIKDDVLTCSKLTDEVVFVISWNEFLFNAFAPDFLKHFKRQTHRMVKLTQQFVGF